MADYDLVVSETADQHLENIYRYGFKNFGPRIADEYMLAIIDQFDLICDNPELYPNVEDLLPNLRRCVCNKHSIYYRIIGDTVEIMAVIGRQDIERILSS